MGRGPQGRPGTARAVGLVRGPRRREAARGAGRRRRQHGGGRRCAGPVGGEGGRPGDRSCAARGGGRRRAEPAGGGGNTEEGDGPGPIRGEDGRSGERPGVVRVSSRRRAGGASRLGGASYAHFSLVSTPGCVGRGDTDGPASPTDWHATRCSASAAFRCCIATVGAML